jgi:radical SAM protein with 4Fe4S-binding SPASM domain
MAVNQPYEFFLQWHLTERCNLRCSHCYQSGATGDELSLLQIRDIVIEAAAMLRDWEDLYGVTIDRSCNVTGGEPFLRKDLYPILETLGEEGFDLYLLSNGTLIDQQRAGALAALGVKGVQVSIEGPEDIHDGIRGVGSFRASIRGTERLLEAGLQVTFNVTLSRLNASCMERLVETAAELGVSRLGFSRLVPSGQGAGLLEQMLSPEEVDALYRKLFALTIPGLQIVTGDPVASQLRRPPADFPAGAALGGCAAGVSGLTLLPDGTILPCRRLEIPIGNVLTDSLREVWATSETLLALRNRRLYHGKCGACPRWAACRGCRAIAHAFSRAYGREDFLSEDPQCFLA